MLEDPATTDTRAARRGATTDRILEAAWAEAKREGLAGISLRRLAAQVGMRAPSLYTYFPSKLAIYDAMYAEGARQMAEAVNGRLLSDDPVETLRARVQRFVDFCTADPIRYQMVMERTVPGFVPSTESFAITVEALAGLRADLEAAGVHGEEQLDLLRALITGIVALQVANDPGGARWTRLVDRAIAMFLAQPVGSQSEPRKGGRKP